MEEEEVLFNVAVVGLNDAKTDRCAPWERKERADLFDESAHIKGRTALIAPSRRLKKVRDLKSKSPLLWVGVLVCQDNLYRDVVHGG